METEHISVKWSEIALKDLETIYYFLCQHSVSAAENIVDSIYRRTSQLMIKGFAESGQTDDINPKIQASDRRKLQNTLCN